MAIDPKSEAALALHRFGLGPRAEAIAKLAADPRGALLADLERPGAGAIDDPNLLTSAEAALAGRDFRQVRKAARLAERVVQDANQQAAQQAARSAPKAGPDTQPGADMSSDRMSGSNMNSASDPNPPPPPPPAPP